MCKQNFLSRIFLYFMLVSVISCRVSLIGDYDEVTDQSIQKIQNDVSALLVNIEKNISDKNDSANRYENFRASYADIEGQLQSLQIRCNALPKYKTIVDQIAPFDSTVYRLERFHKLGFQQSDTSGIRIIRETIEGDFQQMIILQNGLKNKAAK